MPEFDTTLAIAEIESAHIIIGYNLRQITRARDKTALTEYYKVLTDLTTRTGRLLAETKWEERNGKAKDEEL